MVRLQKSTQFVSTEQTSKLSKDNVKATFEGKKATYEMTVKNEAKNIDAVITAELVAKDNTVAFEITKVENKLDEAAPGKEVAEGKLGHPIQTIEIPNHSLVSVNSTQEGANLVGDCNVHKNTGKW